MIIRKPYAFLIRNFRLIHFFMLIISSYVLYRTSITLRFFNEYVLTRQFIESDTLINDTIPLTIAILSFVLIFISLSIVILFRKKDKPILFYIAAIVFYIVLILFSILSRGTLTNLIINGLDPRTSRLFRDVWRIVFYVQIILVGFYLIRTLGFDIKKFNFGEDVNELKIEEEDSEEVELATKFDADKAKMRAAMQKEELKAFYYENRFIIISILILLFVVIPGTLIARNIIVNKKYKETEVIDLKDFEFKVVESYLTKKDYKGNSIFKNENSFLIVKFNIKNLVKNARGIKLNNLRIEANNNVYSPNTTYYEKFIDLGTGYQAQELSNESRDFIAVYVVKDEDLTDEVVLRYADKISVKNNETKANYHRIILELKNLDDNVKTVNIEKDGMLIMNGLKFKVNNSSIKDKFTYEVNEKTKYIVNTTGLVMLFDYEFTGNKTIPTLADFLNEYTTIRYTLNEKTYTEKLTNMTPKDYNEKNKLYIAVKENIKDADSIELVVKLRSVNYIYKLK